MRPAEQQEKAKPGPTLLDFFASPKVQAELAKVLPEHLKPERMMKVLLAAINKVPKLLQCDRNSMYQAAMQLSELGLEPNSALGHAYLLPYDNRKTGKTDAQVIVGYRGFIELARRSGRIKNIRARVVREDEPFKVRLGLNESIEHEYRGNSDSPVVAVYCVAEFVDGGYHFEVMTKSEVDDIRKRSKSSQNGPWETDYVEMAKKTVVRRAAKYLPLSPEMAQAVELDESDIVESTGRVVVAPPLPQQAPAPVALPSETTVGETIEETLPPETDETLVAIQNAGKESIDDLVRQVSTLPKDDPRRKTYGDAINHRRRELRGGA